MNRNNINKQLLLFFLCICSFTVLNAQEQKRELPVSTRQQEFYFNHSADWNAVPAKEKVLEDTVNTLEWYPINFLPPDTTHNKPYDAGNSAIASSGIYTHLVFFNIRETYYGRTTDGKTFTVKDISNKGRYKIASAKIVAFDSTLLLFCCVYINGFAVSPLYLMRSTDNGETFDTARQISNEIFADNQFTFYPVVRGDTVLYYIRGGQKDGRYWHISTDRGITWRILKKNTPNPGAKGLYEYVQATMTSKGLHIAYPKLLKRRTGAETYFATSPDLAKRWRKKQMLSQRDGYSSDYPRIVSSDNDNLHVVWDDGRLGSVDGGWSASMSYRRSTDAGKTWTDEQVLTKRPEALFIHSNGIAIEKTEGKNLAVGWMFDMFEDSSRSKVRVSMDGGQSWTPETIINYRGHEVNVAVTKDILVTVWSELFYYYSYQYYPYARGAKLIRRTRKEETLPAMNIPEERTLNTYPNPFNPNTTFQFHLAAASKVTLRIYDAVGKEVSVLYRDTELEKGTHAIDFHASSLASGVYFAHLSVESMWGDNYREVKKIILLK